ncbi:hypothetical protein CBD41_03320 [bacterium TMED181]|nr:hypothetical protein [Planctomycetota bacterium]OUW45848.1 MAG: hypothetical protein CBD41_03320 [bacterium TMED181]
MKTNVCRATELPVATWSPLLRRMTKSPPAEEEVTFGAAPEAAFFEEALVAPVTVNAVAPIRN